MRKILSLMMAFLLSAFLSLHAQGADPLLIAEARFAETAFGFVPPPEMAAAVFCFGWGYSQGGNDWPNLSYKIGCDQALPPGQPGIFIDYTPLNTPDWDEVIWSLTDGGDGAFFPCAGTLDSSGTLLLSPEDCMVGPLESEVLDGINVPPDLGVGTTVDSVRLVVNQLDLYIDPASGRNVLAYDVTWQFWGGVPPQISGGGQRSDVDDFLRFANPYERSTTLAEGAGTFDVVVFYGATIDQGTFQADLDGVSVAGLFNPVAGGVEVVAVPLSTGRNVLKFQVEGVRSDGRAAVDRDRLVFIVP